MFLIEFDERIISLSMRNQKEIVDCTLINARLEY